MEARKWEDLDRDCLVNVFERVGLKALLFGVPFVCKKWYEATLSPDCWKVLDFATLYKDDTSLYYGNDSNSLKGGLFDSVEEFKDFMFSPNVLTRVTPYLQGRGSTELIKLLVNRSQGTAIKVVLTDRCSLEAMDYLADRCPMLEFISLPDGVLEEHGNHIPSLLEKFRNLHFICFGNDYSTVRQFAIDISVGPKDYIALGSLFNEILTRVSVCCNKLTGIGFINIRLETKEASAIVESLPKIKQLHFKSCCVPREFLLLLAGCSELQELDIKDCIGFEADDEEILKMVSHITTFQCQDVRLNDENQLDDDDFDPDQWSLY